MTEPIRRWPRSFKVGDHDELSRRVSRDDIELFTTISGDRNPLHYDEAVAASSVFGGIIVQGGITSALLNGLVAQRIPGPGTVFLATDYAFHAPVRPGDLITARAEITALRTDKPLTHLSVTVHRDDGVQALSGTAVCYTAELP